MFLLLFRTPNHKPPTPAFALTTNNLQLATDFSLFPTLNLQSLTSALPSQRSAYPSKQRAALFGERRIAQRRSNPFALSNPQPAIRNLGNFFSLLARSVSITSPDVPPGITSSRQRASLPAGGSITSVLALTNPLRLPPTTVLPTAMLSHFRFSSKFFLGWLAGTIVN